MRKPNFDNRWPVETPVISDISIWICRITKQLTLTKAEIRCTDKPLVYLPRRQKEAENSHGQPFEYFWMQTANYKIGCEQ